MTLQFLGKRAANCECHYHMVIGVCNRETHLEGAIREHRSLRQIPFEKWPHDLMEQVFKTVGPMVRGGHPLVASRLLSEEIYLEVLWRKTLGEPI